MKQIFGTLFFLSFISLNSYAYSVFTLNSQNMNSSKPVDVFVAGQGEEMGLQFLFGALTRAKKHEEIYSNSRSQIIVWAKEWSKRKDLKVINDRGFRVIESNSKRLTNNAILKILKGIPSISSFHIISHNAAFIGNKVQDRTDRLSFGNFPWEQLSSSFTEDGFVFLHGCNTGFVVAPEISKKLKRAVFGSLTSTDFQEIFVDGQWYHNNPGFGQFPSKMKKMTRSGELFETSTEGLPCWKGFCHRMMPNNHPYRGYWGKYEIGLPYYQVFCNYYRGSLDDSCEKGAAAGINTTLTISPKSWEDKVIDFMCPRMADPSVHKGCIQVLKGESDKIVFGGNTLRCDREKCSFKLKNGRNRRGKRIKNFFGDDNGNEQLRRDFSFFMGLESYLN